VQLAAVDAIDALQDSVGGGGIAGRASDARAGQVHRTETKAQNAQIATERDVTVRRGIAICHNPGSARRTGIRPEP
jgi:hypothetical protein